MKCVKLNQLCEINIGKTPSRSNSKYWGKGHKWLSIADMKSKYISETKEEITDLAVSEANMKIVPKNTVLMSFKLSIGKIGITTEEMYTNEAIASFPIIEKEKIIPEYLYYVLKTLRYDNLSDRAVMGATLNKKKLNQIVIPLPSIIVQKKIVNLLNKAEELIDKRKAQIEALDQLTQSVFLEMFGDPVLNTKGWKKKKFDYFAKIDTVMIKDFTNYKNSPHIGIENIEKNTGRIINYQTVAKSNITSGKYLFTDKHIIYSKIRPYLNKVALPNFTGVCSADAYPILVHEGKISRYFFAYLLRSNAFLNHVSKNSERTNIPKVNKQQLLSFTGICPPFKLQLEFEEICIKIESYRKIFEKSLKELENNFNSLMQRAFKGELFIEEKVSNL